ncbi:MAG: DNA methyltransferase [archaeon]
MDPFIGAGTTAIAAKRLGMDYLGFDLNKDYIKIANRRVAKYGN